MKETQKTISDWGHKTFGYPKTVRKVVDRMLKEVDELKHWSEYEDAAHDKMADECADIYIMLCHVMTTMGYDLHACVDHKMQVNRHRKWELNGDGTGQHVKEKND